MAGRDIKVRFEGDASDLVKASNQAERAVDDLGGKGGKGALGGLGDSLGGLVNPATLATAAIAGVGLAVYDMTQAAAEDAKAQAVLAQTMRNTAGATDETIASTEDYIASLGKTVGVADDELRPALSNLVVGTKDVATAQDQLGLALDISAATGKDLGTVTEAMMKANLGNTGALGRLGLETKNAAGETLSLAEILDIAKTNFGGVAEAASNTGAGGVARAKIAFDELKESIGAKFLPVLDELARIVNDVVMPAFDGLLKWFDEEWPRIYNEHLKPTMDQIKILFEQDLKTIAKFWEEWGGAIMTIVGFALWAILGTVRTALGAITNMLRVVNAFLMFDWGGAWEEAKNTVGRVVESIKEFVGSIWGRVREAMSGVADLLKAPFIAAFNAIAAAWNNTVGRLEFTAPEWIPGFGGKGWSVPDITPMAVAGAMVVMPPGSDGYDVGRQLASYQRSAGGATGPVALV